MPYRPPELFDLPSDAELDERTDIWVGAAMRAVATHPRDLTSLRAFFPSRWDACCTRWRTGGHRSS